MDSGILPGNRPCHPRWLNRTGIIIVAALALVGAAIGRCNVGEAIVCGTICVLLLYRARKP